jgi:hypothetical protein
MGPQLEHHRPHRHRAQPCIGRAKKITLRVALARRRAVAGSDQESQVETFVPAMNAPPRMGIPLQPAAEGAKFGNRCLQA